MTPSEAVLLTRYVKACCPQQAIDEYTPDAWHDLLGDLTLGDCRDAVRRVAMRQPFVAPAEIRAEVRAIREERIDDSQIPAPNTDDEAEYRRALAGIRGRLGDGGTWPKAVPARGITDPPAVFREARSEEDRDRVLAQSVPCPCDWCPARVGEPCRNPKGDLTLETWHPSRLSAAKAEAADREAS